MAKIHFNFLFLWITKPSSNQKRQMATSFKHNHCSAYMVSIAGRVCALSKKWFHQRLLNVSTFRYSFLRVNRVMELITYTQFKILFLQSVSVSIGKPKSTLEKWQDHQHGEKDGLSWPFLCVFSVSNTVGVNDDKKERGTKTKLQT